MKLLFLRLPCLSFIYFLLFIFLCFIFWSENFREHLLLAMQDLCLIVIKKIPLINEGIDMNIISFFYCASNKGLFWYSVRYRQFNICPWHSLRRWDKNSQERHWRGTGCRKKLLYIKGMFERDRAFTIRWGTHWYRTKGRLSTSEKCLLLNGKLNSKSNIIVLPDPPEKR